MIKKHKIISFLTVVVLIAAGFFVNNFFKKSDGEVLYNIATAEKGTLITSVAGTGQVSAQNQVDIKAKVSGDVILVPVKVGQEVKKGDLIARFDSSDASQAVKDAQENLEEAISDLEQMLEPLDELTLLQAEGSFLQAEQAMQTAEINLQKAYSDGFNTTGNILLNLSGVMSVLSDISFNQWQGIEGISYYSILNQYNKTYADYKSASPYSDASVLNVLFEEIYQMLKDINIVMRSVDNYTYITSTNTYLSSAVTLIQAAKTAENSFANAKRSLRQQTILYEDVKDGADEDELKAQEKIIKQKENALQAARDQLNEYYITAPFDGIIADLNVHEGDSIASISSYGTIATIITENKIVTISLNEVDATNIKVGQKTNINFDAIDGLGVVGEVLEVDTIGTVSQGVVTYNIKIAFEAEDERVKPGMSASAIIITQAKQDVILVPVSAVKSSGSVYYVEVLEASGISSASGLSSVASNNPPRQIEVTLGLSNDDYTEILSGINEGDIVITKTISSSGSSSVSSSSNGQSQSGSLLQTVGGGQIPMGGRGF